MNREIKFRGKRADTGEWIYGSFLNDKTLDEGDISSYAIWSNEGDGNWFDVEPESVCQFTGLTDNTGIEVYEGDYLVDRWVDDEDEDQETLLPVVWDHENMQWCVDTSFIKDGSHLTGIIEYFGEFLEVKGNVFENPKSEEQ